MKPDLDYPRKHFRFALLEYRAASTPEDVILKRETFWKEALLTRAVEKARQEKARQVESSPERRGPERDYGPSR